MRLAIISPEFSDLRANTMALQDDILKMQTAVTSTSSLPEGELRTLGEQYAKACADVNERLAQCISYLRQGFRGECIRLCEMEPNLLHRFNRLMFRGRQEWLKIAADLGIQTPTISEPYAREINDAYDSYKQHEDRVKEFRLLNTMQRPVEERAVALQELRKAEPGNRNWEDNLTSLRAK